MAKDNRGRNWTFLVYPDSAPKNWREIIMNWHVAGCISPLHEFDINPTGEAKKAHWHVIVCFEGNKSESQIKELIAPLNSPLPFQVESVRGMVRYFVHKDNPEKYQYDKSGMVGFSGFQWESYFDYAEIERRKAIKDMRQAIRTYAFTEYSDFCDFCDESHPEWTEILDTNGSYVISLYITSMRHKLEGETRK